MTNRLRLLRTGLFCAVMTLGVVALDGQTPAPAAPAQAAAAGRHAARDPHGRALQNPDHRVRCHGAWPSRIRLVADVTVVEPRELLIDGKGPGTVSLIIWGETTRIQYDVVVDPGVSGLQRQIQTLFPGEDITGHRNAGRRHADRAARRPTT